MPTTTFRYDSVPLVRPSQQIRLLALADELATDAEISGILTVHDLDECPPYAAISYTWGDLVPKLAISINGSALVVQHNCWYALWQMRYQRQHNMFWIDQICIDQHSIAEKNAQVAAMGEIYGGAAMVASCLGSGRSLEALQKFDPQEDDRDPATRDALAALETLQHNPYFNRLWIKQEVILGRHVRLYCGTSWMEWEEFAKLSSASKSAKLRSMTIRTRHPKSLTAMPVNHLRLIEGREQQWAQVQGLVDMSHGDDESGQQPWASLWQLLTQYGDGHCQVRHDKFYAVLSLVPPTKRPEVELPVDYNSDLLSLALLTIDNVLQELATSTDETTIPVEMSLTIMKLARDWLHLDASDNGVEEFLGKRPVPSGPPVISERDVEAMKKASRSPFYLRNLVMRRYTISDMPLQELGWLGDWAETQVVSGAAKCSMTNDMTAGALHQYLCSCSRHWFNPDFEGEEDYSSFTGRSGLKSLPPGLAVKVVQYNHISATFLVSPATQIGDEILAIEMESPGGPGFGYMPIIRRCVIDAQTPAVTSSKMVYSVLIGWALQVDRTGRLNHQMPGDMESPAWPDWDNVAFNLHYEDLMVLAMIERDPTAILTCGCMHHERPSFLQEPINMRYAEETVQSQQAKSTARISYDEHPSILGEPLDTREGDERLREHDPSN